MENKNSHWRTPIKKVCENCGEDYFITSGKIKQRRYCTLPCSVEGKKKTRILMRMLPRYSESIMWKRYWYHRFRGMKTENIPDQEHADEFARCDRELKERTFINNKIPYILH